MYPAGKSDVQRCSTMPFEPAAINGGFGTQIRGFSSRSHCQIYANKIILLFQYFKQIGSDKTRQMAEI
jgi:hypothetical protein